MVEYEIIDTKEFGGYKIIQAKFKHNPTDTQENTCSFSIRKDQVTKAEIEKRLKEMLEAKVEKPSVEPNTDELIGKKYNIVKGD